MAKSGQPDKKEKKGVKGSSELEVVKSMLARALADYDNLSKRIEREKEALTKLASLSVLSRLLPILDNLELTEEHLEDPGLAISIGEFKKVLNDEGLTEIKPSIGDEFDENTMEVVEITAGKSNNVISEVVLKGWKFEDGQVIRHAKVKVSKVRK